MPKVYDFEWHNDSCIRKDERVEKTGYKKFWCVTHGQWACEVPVKVTITYEYGDGDVRSIVHERKVG